MRRLEEDPDSVISFLPPFSFPDVTWYLTDLNWEEGTPFEAKAGGTAFIEGLLVEVSRGFPQP